MLDAEDEGTRIGVAVALGVVFALLIGLVGGLALRQAQRGTPSAPASAETLPFIEAPLEGELVATVHFALGRSALPEDARAAFEKTVEAAQAAPQRRIVLSGFHDASGSAAVNAGIARARALAVREALTAEGLSGSRIALRKPAATLGDGSAPEARRVEIRLVD